MTTQFFNSFRTSKNLKNSGNSVFSNSNKNCNRINLEKRKKLKNLIVEKLYKKYNISKYEPIVLDEVDAFIHCDNLSNRDLKNLDKRIQHILIEKGIIKNNDASEKLSNNLPQINKKEITEKQTSTSYNIETNNNKFENNINNDNKCDKDNSNTNNFHDNNKTTKRTMSGASHLSKMFENNNYLKNRNDPYVPGEELIKPKKIPHRFEFEHEEDMWNAFNNVNRRLYEQERLDEKLKDKEIKRRTKEDLDNQIKYKLLRLEEERNKNNEYHGILVKHIDNLNNLEDEKQKRIKDKIIKEKENRDKQMWDQNYKKKLDKIKMRKYENQLLTYIDGEIKKEKDNIIKKKIEAKESLLKTIEENKHNKILKEKQLQKERDDDMKCMEEYNRILEKQEADRANYFKNIEAKSTDFMAKMTDTVLKNLKEKNDVNEKRMDDFLKQKEEKAVLAEKERIIKNKEDKKKMKEFLDMQVEEKKKLGEFEKDLDAEQAFIIKKDYELYEEYKRDAAQKVCL